MLQLTQQQRAMFCIENYKFSTRQLNRHTTLYFSNGTDGGRIKRSASAGGRGGMVIYQRGCKRIFINFYESLRISGMGEDRVSVDVAKKMKEVYKMLSTHKADSRTKLLYSLVPRAGWRVFEIYEDKMHGSAGTVVFGDPDATRVKILAMMYDDSITSS